MTVPAQRSRRPRAYGIALPLLLTAVLVAVAILFAQSWSGLSERHASAERERQGVEYLRSLNQVMMALIDMQTAAAAGRTVSRDELNHAVEGATSVDARLGEALRTRERWDGVRAKIEALPERGLSRPPQDVYDAYTETGSLLLALYGKVRESSGLSRDPDADAYHLQDSAAEELPEALIAAGRLAALSRLASTRGADDQIRTAVELNAARSAVLEPAEDLVEGLQAAVDNTTSRRLSGNLLRHLDAYQQAMEALTAAAGDDRPGGPDPEQVEAARSTTQGAAAKLVEVLLAELDALIVTRLDGLTGQRRLAGATAAAALLLGLVLAYLLLAPRPLRAARRGGASDDSDPAQAGPAGSDVDPGDPANSWDRRSRDWAGPAPFDFRPAPVDAPPAAPVGLAAPVRAAAGGPVAGGPVAGGSVVGGSVASGAATGGTTGSGATGGAAGGATGGPVAGGMTGVATGGGATGALGGAGGAGTAQAGPGRTTQWGRTDAAR